MNDYLYHYTNLNSLALILKNRTIRFNSLKNMDDAEEVITKNSPFLGKYCFVSSWTDLENESIPFWAMYTDNMTGLRIKMRKYPFEKHTMSLEYYDNGKAFETYCPQWILEKYNVLFYATVPFLRKIEYTNNENLIFPEPIKCMIPKADGTFDFNANFNDIDRYKRDSWSFQSEWRYSLVFLPSNKAGGLQLDLSAREDLPFWHIDIKIDEEAFNNLEILTGPKMPDGDKIMLHSIVDQYCPLAKILESKLKIN